MCYSNAHCRLWTADSHCDFLIPNLFGRCQCNAPFRQLGDSCVRSAFQSVSTTTLPTPDIESNLIQEATTTNTPSSTTEAELVTMEAETRKEAGVMTTEAVLLGRRTTAVQPVSSIESRRYSTTPTTTTTTTTTTASNSFELINLLHFYGLVKWWKLKCYWTVKSIVLDLIWKISINQVVKMCLFFRPSCLKKFFRTE